MNKQQKHPFDNNGKEDLTLVQAAITGDASALEALIKSYQHWLYNLSLHMLGSVQDAEDATQEILIRMITGLSGFRGKSRFSTWLYRIAVNSIFDFRKKNTQNNIVSFEQYGESIDRTPDAVLAGERYSSEELRIIADEVSSHCLLGMLLCLAPEQRILIVLADIFTVPRTNITAILNLSAAVMRKRLQRARTQLYHFMNGKCGLIDRNNSCHCSLKAKALVQRGLVDPENLVFYRDTYPSLLSMIPQKQRQFRNFYDEKCSALFLSRPFDTHYDFVPKMREIIHSKAFTDVMTLQLH